MKRLVDESPLRQGPDEEISYNFNWAAVGTPSTAGVVTIRNKSGADTSEANLTGDPTLATNTVTTPVVSGLSAKGTYYLKSLVTIGARKLSAILEIDVDAY